MESRWERRPDDGSDDDNGMTDFLDLPDLAGERLGGAVLYANDDFFAAKENLVRVTKPIWKEHEYTDRGKWMDGWESRRKRGPGHDFAVLRLGAPGVIRGVVVDTSFFRGNYPAQCSIEACHARPETAAEALLSEAIRWIPILPKSDLQGDSENRFPIDDLHGFTHVRLHIYPDGGVARLRVHGEVVPDWHREGGLTMELDLAAVEHGGQVLTCSDMFFGPKHNLIMPGRAQNMADGWETKRRRGPGHDWVIVQLGYEAVVRRIELDTAHFKGNYPDSCSIDAARSAGGEWSELLARTKLEADTRHMFIDELQAAGPIRHLRLNVYPDGGISRMRVYASASEAGRGAAVVESLNTMLEERAETVLTRCCASSSWVRAMMAARPFAGWNDLVEKADRIWWSLEPADWREAFSAHPRIGERKPGASWAADEQSGAASAASETVRGLIEANQAYEKRFGHIYIVCATGKSGEEMLAMARERLESSPEEELRIAAEEQRKITRLRLLKLVS
jgi:allantoicase